MCDIACRTVRFDQAQEPHWSVPSSFVLKIGFISGGEPSLFFLQVRMYALLSFLLQICWRPRMDTICSPRSFRCIEGFIKSASKYVCHVIRPCIFVSFHGPRHFRCT